MAYSGSGLGTINDPYVILTAGQLDEIRNHAGSYFELGSDIDASDMANWDSNKGWKTIGDSSNSFKVYLDGKGFKIKNFYQNRPQETGMHGVFAGLESGGYVRNLIFEDIFISGDNVGGLSANSACDITNVHVKGEIIYKGDWSGGVVGYAEESTVENCSFDGDIYSNVNFTKYIGGVLGSAWDMKVKGCRASGYVAGYDHVAGIIGMTYAQCEVEDCYNEAEIDYSWFGAGIIGTGYGSDSIKRCYNSGYVHAVPGGSDAIMAFASGGSPTTANNYYDSQTSGSSSSLGTGRTTAQMKTKSTFQNWNMVDLKDFVNEIWFIDEGLDYPRLGWEFEGEDEEPERNISASLVNKKQSLSAVAKVLNKAIATLTNKKQSLSASIIHEVEEIDISASLTNKKQVLNATAKVEVKASATLKNKKQVVTFTAKNVIGASAVLKNSKQSITATAKNIVTAFGSLVNGKQKLKATVTKEDARSASASLKNKPQALTSSVSVIVKAVAVLKNKAQKITASLKALNKAQATLRNKPQKAKVFISLDEMARVASVVLKNKPQRIAATLTNEVKLIVGLTNDKQKIKACIVDLSDRSVQVGLTNNPQYCKVVVRSQKLEADYEIIIDRNELFLHVEENHREIFIVK